MTTSAITTRMERVIDALDASAKQYPIKALAPDLKTELTAAKAESTLRAELNQSHGYKLGLVTAVLIMRRTGDLTPLDLIEAIFHRTALRLPDAVPGDPVPLMGMLARLSKEFSETVQEVADAMVDGKLEAHEKTCCLKELDDLIQAAVQFKGILQHMHHQDGAK